MAIAALIIEVVRIHEALFAVIFVIILVSKKLGHAEAEGLREPFYELAPVDDKRFLEDEDENDHAAYHGESDNVFLAHSVWVEVLGVVAEPGFARF